MRRRSDPVQLAWIDVLLIATTVFSTNLLARVALRRRKSDMDTMQRNADLTEEKAHTAFHAFCTREGLPVDGAASC